MEFKLEGRCVLTLSHKQGDKTSKHVSTDFNLAVSNNLSQSVYLHKDGLPTQEGSKCLTNCFVQGLVGNVHYAHQKGYRDSAEHLRYIIAKLEEGFSKVANVYKSEFDDE